MISSIEFCINHASRIHKLGLTGARLAFRPGYNVLIGPNGSGKSTVLRAAASCALCKVDRPAETHIQYITTETLNPLVGGTFASREEMVQGIRSMFLSHGKGVLDSVRHQKLAAQATILVDSPETGQDQRNGELIHQGLLQMADRYQVIVATHSLTFMRGGNLIDLGEHYLRLLVDSTGRLADAFGYAAHGDRSSRQVPSVKDASGAMVHGSRGRSKSENSSS